jgi:hypothetical protein
MCRNRRGKGGNWLATAGKQQAAGSLLEERGQQELLLRKLRLQQASSVVAHRNEPSKVANAATLPAGQSPGGNSLPQDWESAG